MKLYQQAYMGLMEGDQVSKLERELILARTTPIPGTGRRGARCPLPNPIEGRCAIQETEIVPTLSEILKFNYLNPEKEGEAWSTVHFYDFQDFYVLGTPPLPPPTRFPSRALCARIAAE